MMWQHSIIFTNRTLLYWKWVQPLYKLCDIILDIIKLSDHAYWWLVESQNPQANRSRATNSCNKTKCLGGAKIYYESSKIVHNVIDILRIASKSVMIAHSRYRMGRRPFSFTLVSLFFVCGICCSEKCLLIRWIILGPHVQPFGYVFAIWWCCNRNVHCFLAIYNRLKTLTMIRLKYVLLSYNNMT